MTLQPLSSLSIANLRGAIAPYTLTFERGKKLTIVYGENGSGKSTICDALELLANGRVGSLENRGLGKTDRYWASLGRPMSEVRVELTMASVRCSATLVRGSVVAEPTSARPRVEVLRRGQILTLLEARPGERYEAIKPFIDLTGIETTEGSLRQTIREMRGQLEIATARILENRQELERLAAAAGQPATNSLDWAAAEATRDPGTASTEIAALRQLQATYDRLATHPNRLREAAQEARQARKAADAARDRSISALDEVTGEASELVAVLEAASLFVQQHANLEACPICERPTTAPQLATRLTTRLDAFTAYREAREAGTSTEATAAQAEATFRAIREQAGRDVEAFEMARAGFSWPADIALPQTPAPRERGALGEWLVETAELPEAWARATADRQDRQRFVTTLRGALRAYGENRQLYDELAGVLPALERTLAIVEQERKSFTDGILTAIAGDVGRLYEAIHPGEGLEKISLILDPKRRASLAISGRFGGVEGLPPQAYFSQAHLDTLGLCIFLALSRRNNPAATILVLDDVLGSVDEPHNDRLIEVLCAEARHFRHCIITTHYGPWRHKLRWGWLKAGQCQFIELAPASAAGGIVERGSLPDVARLRALLDEPAPDPQLICAKAGVILEAALDFLTQLYGCPVPRRAEPRYTLGELLPAINKKLRAALRVEVCEGTASDGTPLCRAVPLGPLLDELDQIAQARNVMGCHFNALAFDLLDRDAVRFGDRVLTLIDALADPEVGWPGKDKSGSYWANAGETRRLHPLRRPS